MQPTQQTTQRAQDGRPSHADDDHLARIRTLIQQQAGKSIGLTIATLAGGIVVSLLTAMLFARFIAAVAGRLGLDPQPVQFVALVACIVLLLVAAWRIRRYGDSDSTELLAGIDGRPASYGEFEAQRVTVIVAIVRDIARLGPRLLVSGLDRLPQRREALDVDPDRAAEVVWRLLKAGKGLPPRQLLRPDETIAELSRMVGYLRQINWVDVSRRRDRVWLTSSARARLGG